VLAARAETPVPTLRTAFAVPPVLLLHRYVDDRYANTAVLAICEIENPSTAKSNVLARRFCLSAPPETRSVVNALEDVGLLLLIVLLCPLAILVIGAPVVLLVRLLIEIVARL
jgi:hypothetical protein